MIPWQELQKFEPPIGYGSFGDVYKGRFNEADVAIKELRESRDLTPEFNLETQLMWKCQFPNILKLIGVCTEPGHCSMVFEFMPQGSLDDLLRSQVVIPERQRWQIAIDIANGLDRLHSNNVLHHDLKSNNILLNGQGRAHIADFGLARLMLSPSTKHYGNIHPQFIWRNWQACSLVCSRTF